MSVSTQCLWYKFSGARHSVKRLKKHDSKYTSRQPSVGKLPGEYLITCLPQHFKLYASTNNFSNSFQLMLFEKKNIAINQQTMKSIIQDVHSSANAQYDLANCNCNLINMCNCTAIQMEGVSEVCASHVRFTDKLCNFRGRQIYAADDCTTENAINKLSTVEKCEVTEKFHFENSVNNRKVVQTDLRLNLGFN